MTNPDLPTRLAHHEEVQVRSPRSTDRRPSRVTLEDELDPIPHLTDESYPLRPTREILSEFGFPLEEPPRQSTDRPDRDTMAEFLMELGDAVLRTEARFGANAVRYADLHATELGLVGNYEATDSTTRAAFVYLALEMKDRLRAGVENDSISPDFLQVFKGDYSGAVKKFGLINTAKIQRHLNRDEINLPDLMSVGRVDYDTETDQVYFTRNRSSKGIRELEFVARSRGKKLVPYEEHSPGGGYTRRSVRFGDIIQPVQPAAPVARAAPSRRDEYIPRDMGSIGVSRFPVTGMRARVLHNFSPTNTYRHPGK